MCSDTATSVSKGCFVYKGKRRRVCETDYIQSSNKFMKTSFKLFKQTWDEIEMQIDILKSDLNCQIFNDLVKFLRTCHEDFGRNDGRPTEEIPAAILLTGVNTPDHRVMFSSLQSLLKDSVTPYVASLLSKDCSCVSSLIKAVISNLTDAEMENLDESVDEDNQNHESSFFPLKFVPRGTAATSLMTLVNWYSTVVHDVRSILTSDPYSDDKVDSSALNCHAAGKKNIPGSKPLIVIMFEDVENVKANVIQDFISICSSYMNQLPIVFVMGVATSMSALHQLLPSSVSSLLCMEKFQAPPASQYLTHLMDKIVMTEDVPFKLGPKVFHFLLDIFLYHNFSIMNFTCGFQYCMLEHFLNNPLSFLCVNYDDIDKVTQNLSHGQLQFFRHHSAFEQFIKETSSRDRKDVTVDDALLRRSLASALKSFYTYHSEMFVMMRFLHALTSGLPKQPLGKQLREIYSICLSQNIAETEDFTHAFQLLKMMSRQDVTEVLTNSLPALEAGEEKSPSLKSFCIEVKSFIHRLTYLNEEEEDDVAKDGVMASTNIRLLPKRAKLHELKETLLSMPSNRKMSPFERLRNEILNELQEDFRQFLICPINKALHEIFYFNDLAQVKDHFRAVPRCSIQRALTQPSRYLNCACCECDVDEILPSMPDICIVYKLHLECGTLVNLYDWMQAFITIVSQDNGQGKRRKRQTQKPESHLRARFIRAVSELQFLGFIKSTRRKTDHVERLTW